MHPGQGAGLSLRDLGEIGGSPTVTLLITEMPVHVHAVNATYGFPKDDALQKLFPGESAVPPASDALGA